MWRPAGWTGRMFNEQAIEIMTPTERGACQTEYEAGADAMLEALKRSYGDKIKKDEWTDDSTFQADTNGIIISFIIPDEED